MPIAYDKKNNPLYFEPACEVKRMVGKIREYFIENGPNSKAVIGISGGKDSTIAAALLVRALGRDNVVGVLMPDGEQADIVDSYRVCKILGIRCHKIDIEPVMNNLLEGFHLHINDTILTNTPARIRMTILYMVAASVGGRVINTCNFSEDYVGYSTKYGDLAGDFSLFKEYTVREVVALGDALEELPEDLVHKVPADGMCGSSDEDNLGFSYEILDALLLEDRMPEDYEVYKEIMLRHERNLHKKCIKIPAIPSGRGNCPGALIYEDKQFW